MILFRFLSPPYLSRLHSPARPPARPRSCGLLGARSSFIYWASVHFQGGKGRKKEKRKKGGAAGGVCTHAAAAAAAAAAVDVARRLRCQLGLPSFSVARLPVIGAAVTLTRFSRFLSLSSVSASYSSPECDLSLRYFAPSIWMLCHAWNRRVCGGKAILYEYEMRNELNKYRKETLAYTLLSMPYFHLRKLKCDRGVKLID